MTSRDPRIGPDLQLAGDTASGSRLSLVISPASPAWNSPTPSTREEHSPGVDVLTLSYGRTPSPGGDPGPVSPLSGSESPFGSACKGCGSGEGSGTGSDATCPPGRHHPRSHGNRASIGTTLQSLHSLHLRSAGVAPVVSPRGPSQQPQPQPQQPQPAQGQCSVAEGVPRADHPLGIYCSNCERVLAYVLCLDCKATPLHFCAGCNRHLHRPVKRQKHRRVRLDYLHPDDDTDTDADTEGGEGAAAETDGDTDVEPDFCDRGELIASYRSRRSGSGQASFLLPPGSPLPPPRVLSPQTGDFDSSSEGLRSRRFRAASVFVPPSTTEAHLHHQAIAHLLLDRKHGRSRSPSPSPGSCSGPGSPVPGSGSGLTPPGTAPTPGSGGGGQKAVPTWYIRYSALPATAATAPLLCANCEEQAAEVWCEQCQRFFCGERGDRCGAALHRPISKRTHELYTLLDAALGLSLSLSLSAGKGKGDATSASAPATPRHASGATTATATASASLDAGRTAPGALGESRPSSGASTASLSLSLSHSGSGSGSTRSSHDLSLPPLASIPLPRADDASDGSGRSVSTGSGSRVPPSLPAAAWSLLTPNPPSSFSRQWPVSLPFSTHKAPASAPTHSSSSSWHASASTSTSGADLASTPCGPPASASASSAPPPRIRLAVPPSAPPPAPPPPHLRTRRLSTGSLAAGGRHARLRIAIPPSPQPHPPPGPAPATLPTPPPPRLSILLRRPGSGAGAASSPLSPALSPSPSPSAPAPVALAPTSPGPHPPTSSPSSAPPAPKQPNSVTPTPFGFGSGTKKFSIVIRR